MDIQGSFDEMTLNLSVTDHYSKLTRAIPLSKATSIKIANLFYVHWLLPNGIPIYLLIDNDVQYTNKCLAYLCTLLGFEHLATPADHLQPHGQAERDNKATLTRFQHYDAEHRKD